MMPPSSFRPGLDDPFTLDVSTTHYPDPKVDTGPVGFGHEKGGERLICAEGITKRVHSDF